MKIAGELYEKTIAIIQNSKEAGEMTLASVAMAPDEVHVGALAGLGQLATHRGYVNFTRVINIMDVNFAANYAIEEIQLPMMRLCAMDSAWFCIIGR